MSGVRVSLSPYLRDLFANTLWLVFLQINKFLPVESVMRRELLLFIGIPLLCQLNEWKDRIKMYRFVRSRAARKKRVIYV